MFQDAESLIVQSVTFHLGQFSGNRTYPGDSLERLGMVVGGCPGRPGKSTFATHHPSLSNKYDVADIQPCRDRWRQSNHCHPFRGKQKQKGLDKERIEGAHNQHPRTRFAHYQTR